MPLRRGRLADIQAQQVEVGRIRLGSSTPKTARSGKEYNEPVKLETFRLTSRSKDLIEEASLLYGGECVEWVPQNGGAKQWQVLTERRSIAVVVPPDPVSQFYEVWSGGKCQRRCDGITELLNDVPCPCGPDPSQRRCKPTTRLNLMLTEMSGIGVWRLETHGYYAAAELPAVADLLSAAGGNVPARLEMEERTATVPDPRKSGEEMVTRFMVPVLHVQRTPGQLMQILGGTAAVPTIEAPEQPALPAATQPSALVAAAAQDYDPDQERQRVQQALYAQFLERIVEATDTAGLQAVGRTIAQSGLPAQSQHYLRQAWKDQMGKLAAAAAQPTPQPPPAADVPTQNGAGKLDRVAEFTALQTTAAALGLSFSGLRDRFAEFTNGGKLSESTAEQIFEFHRYLKEPA